MATSSTPNPLCRYEHSGCHRGRSRLLCPCREQTSIRFFHASCPRQGSPTSTSQQGVLTMSFFKSIAAPLATVGAICGVLALTAPANAEAGGRIACEVREVDRYGREVTSFEYGRLDFYPGSDMQLQVGHRETVELTMINGAQAYDQYNRMWVAATASGGFGFGTNGLNMVCVVAE